MVGGLPEVLAQPPVAHPVVRTRHTRLARLVFRDSGFGFWVSVSIFGFSAFWLRG